MVRGDTHHGAGLINRGDDVILTRAQGKIEPGRVLEWEVEYLRSRGYDFVDDFKLTKK